jgi:hypothetical protein
MAVERGKWKGIALAAVGVTAAFAASFAFGAIPGSNGVI